MTVAPEQFDPAADSGACPEWRSLPGEFFTSDEIYRTDTDRVWRRGWLFAGHDCEIPSAGDYFTFNLGTDPLIVIRGEDGVVREFDNVCRHRDTSGSARQLVCPYHQWVYGKDGKLLSYRGMHQELDSDSLGLLPVATENLCGFIIVNLDDRPVDFGPAREQLELMLKQQGVDRAKVARAVNYTVRANWKLVWENNRDCYHCNLTPPQYIKANYDHFNTDSSSPKMTACIDEKAEEGRDYDLEKLMPFWQLTSEHDWELCEAAQLGVQFSGYRPGPYSKYNEYNVKRFVSWYLNQLAKFNK